jgi:hypothetical protein
MHPEQKHEALTSVVISETGRWMDIIFVAHGGANDGRK